MCDYGVLKHCTSSMYLCWGAMAGLYYFHGIQKIALKQMMFGVFENKIIESDLLVSGLDEVVHIPHSRHSDIDEETVKKSGLKILLAGKQSGISVLKDEKYVFILGHPEYAKDTLLLEYERDKQKRADYTKAL